MVNINTEILDFGEFVVEKKKYDSKVLSNVVRAKDDSFVESDIGDINVIPLKDGAYLLSSESSNIVVRKSLNEVKFDFFDYRYEIEMSTFNEITGEGIVIERPVEIEQSPYKVTDYLLSHGLIILRDFTKYVLYDFVNGKVISNSYHNIDEKDGRIIAELINYGCKEYFELGWHRMNYPTDILVGELNIDGSMKDGQLMSQKLNTMIMFDDKQDLTTQLELYEGLQNSPNDITFDYEEYLSRKNEGRK